MNRPTSDPSLEGSRHSSASRPFPSWEGLGVGSWSRCMSQTNGRLSTIIPRGKREPGCSARSIGFAGWAKGIHVQRPTPLGCFNRPANLFVEPLRR